MSIFKYDEELHMATVRGEGLEEGLARGREEGAALGRRLLAGMRKRGMSVEEISELTGEPVETISEESKKPFQLFR